jgi:hypothetical protein
MKHNSHRASVLCTSIAITVPQHFIFANKNENINSLLSYKGNSITYYHEIHSPYEESQKHALTTRPHHVMLMVMMTKKTRF